MITASAGNLDAFNLLFKASDAHTDGAGASLIDHEGHSVLMVAVYGENQEIVDMLLQDRVDQLRTQAQQHWVFSTPPAIHSDPALRSESGQTALHLAAKQGNSACVQALLARMSEEEKVKCVFQRDSAGPKGKNARDFAVQVSGQDDSSARWDAYRGCVEALDTVMTSSIQALCAAAKSDQRKDLKSLLDQGIDPNVPDKQGERALLHAIRSKGSGNNVRLLLEAGANPHLISFDEATELGAVLDQHIKVQSSNLFAAATAGNLDAVNLSLQRGADFDLTDKHDQTALILAAAKGHTSHRAGFGGCRRRY